MRPELVKPAEHHRQRLVRAPLALLETAHDVAVGGVARQVKAAQSFERHDLAAEQQLGGGADGGGGVVRLAFGKLHDPAGVTRSVLVTQSTLVGALTAPHQPNPRAAHGAGVGFGVKAPVAGVLVLLAAGRAEREAPHRRALTVVGQVLDDREARAAVGAVGERIVVAPVGRVQHLAPAVRAGGDVRRHQLVGVRVDQAAEDGERRRALRLRRGALAGRDVRARRRLPRQRVDESLHGGRRAFSQDLHAGRGVAHPAGDAVALRQRVDERPKADALHHAAHAQPDSLERVCRTPVRLARRTA